MKTPVATAEQRRKTLRNIRHIEGRMLPPGWDKGLEHQFGRTLVDPAAQQRREPTERARPTSAPAHQPLPLQPMPSHTALRLRALGQWLMAAAVAAGLSLTWIYHP